jgi:hypothetical protein
MATGNVYATQPNEWSATITNPNMTDAQVNSACDMTALASQDRTKHNEAVHKLFQSVDAISELSDGYAFHLPSGDEVLLPAVGFISKEKLCCPCFQLELRIESGGRSQWLHLTGPSGIKPFILAEISAALSPAVASKAGFQAYK